jgi:hypothetical protein
MIAIIKEKNKELKLSFEKEWRKQEDSHMKQIF